MKKKLVLIGLVFLTPPLWADNALTPEPLQQSVREYVRSFKTGSPNEKNHVIWKLYVYDPIYPERGTPDRMLGGVNPLPRGSFIRHA